MSRFVDNNGPAEIGETWYVLKRDKTEIKLTFGEHKGQRVWFFPRTDAVYRKQDLIGLVRKVAE